ncbi:uncharacterized protein LOC135951145 [Calliphora vicina]|uniref:uncharacterized protein LOC135951145 n=1 Tax=Calliphora vicina TaxID=7373 RepID=UPI00325C08E1
MLNICAKTLWRCQPLKQTYRILALQNYASFSVKDILYETSDEAGTLLTRFAKHVAQERQKVCEQVPSDVKYSDYFPISDVRYFHKELEKTPKEQLAAVIIYASTYRSNAEPAKFAIVLNELDRHASDNVEDMNADTILRTLYAFLFLIPNWMTRLDFYGRAMQRLHEEFNKDANKSKEQFVQLCFYMGLSKKQTRFNVNKLLNSLLDENLSKYMKDFSTIDMALVSNAAYKTSNIIKNEDFNQRLLKEVLDISHTSNGNDALLINFIKSMRLQRLRSPIVCEYITNICQDAGKLRQLQARGQVHLFAYLAENLWDSKNCTQPLVDTITEQLTLSRHSNRSYTPTIRGKDIATFLWSCAQLNCSLSSIQFRTIENSLIEKLNANEFNYFSDHLVDSCLSLWTLGYKTKELLQAAVQLKSESTNKRHQPKVDSRITVLLSAAQIEEPAWCASVIKGFEAFNVKAKFPSNLLKNQSIPYQEIIGQLLKEEYVSSANLTCPINGINIPGIHVKLSSPPDSQLFVEFITPSQSLHFSQEPVAILRLKLRLLESLGHKVKVLSSTNMLDPQTLKEAITDSAEQGEHIKEPAESSIKA